MAFDSLGDIAAIVGLTSAAAGTAASFFAGDAQADAAEDAQRSTAAQAAQTRQDFAPWRGQGQVGLSSLADLMGQARPTHLAEDKSLGALSGAEIPFASFEGSPGYQFRLDEGRKAIENSAAARGMLRSGGRLKAMERFAQGTAAPEYNNEFNRRALMAGVGQTATAQDAGLQAGFTARGNQAGLDAATARGSSFVGAANGVGNAFNNLLMQQAFFGGR